MVRPPSDSVYPPHQHSSVSVDVSTYAGYIVLEHVRGQVVSWSSAGTSGFKGTRRGTPFAAQTAAANAIRTVVDQGQDDTIGIAMRRALLGEIEGTCITRVKSEKVPHEYSTITGIQESVHEILMNLKEIVLISNLYGTSDAPICVKGPGYVTAQDIIFLPYVETVDNTQHIASLTEPIDFCIG
ncbi:DNA-directed RNA polymerase subunit alpha [Capsicum annuum]|nr:DNA-directed RNA polymerase subunit alpha [Capsicum annuum]